jgi:hypothetical protein
MQNINFIDTFSKSWRCVIFSQLEGLRIDEFFIFSAAYCSTDFREVDEVATHSLG